jgi:hypothetical protein
MRTGLRRSRLLDVVVVVMVVVTVMMVAMMTMVVVVAVMMMVVMVGHRHRLVGGLGVVGEGRDDHESGRHADGGNNLLHAGSPNESPPRWRRSALLMRGAA